MSKKKWKPAEVAVDGLCEILRVDTPEKYMDKMDEWGVGMEAYAYAYKEALKLGHSEAEAEELAQIAESEERDEVYTKWEDAVIYVAEKLFGEHHLNLIFNKRKRCFRVAPTVTWRLAADEIARTISGVGYFEFANGKALKESVPEPSYRAAVMSHVHWVKDWPAVYGEGTAESMLDRRLR
jgi:hypothetical protein